MLLTQNYSLLRIIRLTWKVDLFLIVTCAASYYAHEYLFPSAIQIPPTLPTLLGTAIAFFIGFNNNQAYDRWWEARIIWGGLINDSRSWARNILYCTTAGTLETTELNMLKKQMIFRQIGFIYLLKNNLRRSTDPYYKKYLSDSEIVLIMKETNVPNAVLTLHAKDVQKLSENNSLDELRFLQINQFVTLFTEHQGKCERIRNTVFPTSYIYFTSLFIWVLVIFTTLMLSDSIGSWAILISWIIGFVFHVSHKNGMSLMDPFDETATGIPLNQMAQTIEINLLEMLGEKEVPEPLQPINNEYIL